MTTLDRHVEVSQVLNTYKFNQNRMLSRGARRVIAFPWEKAAPRAEPC